MYIYDEEIYFIDNPRDTTNFLVYVPLRRFLGLLPVGIRSEMTNSDSVIFRKMIREIKKHPLIGCKQYEANFDETNTLHINLTDNCQLRCTYCYNRSCESVSDRTFTKDEITSIIDSYAQYVESNNISTLKFALFGGAEPTWNKELFYHTVEYIKDISRRHNKKYVLTMTTNGFYDDSVMKYIIDNFTGVTLSLDGPKNIHDAQRITWGNKGSYGYVFPNAKLLHNSSIMHNYRVTVTKKTLEDWKNVLDFFIENFPRDRVTFAPLLPIGRGEELTELLPDEQMWKKIACQMYEYARDKIDIRFPGVNGPEVCRLHYCGATNGKMWIISKDGTFVSCAHDRNCEQILLGKYNFEEHEILIDNRKIESLINEFSSNQLENCKECFCRYTCAGGCPSYRMMNLKQNCDLIRTITSFKFVDSLTNDKSSIC